MGMLPGVGKIKQQMAAGAMDDKVIKRQGAIISSMTPYERRHPKVLDGKRKRRIASGSGTRPDEINRLLKMHRQMADMMKMMGKNKGMMQRMAGAFGMGGGAGGPSGAEIERMQAELARLDPKALEQLPKEVREQLGAGSGAGKGPAPSLPGLGKAMPRLPGLPGLGGATPRLPGLPGFPGKKK
jgi:signal recognition particle subunit SRP54